MISCNIVTMDDPSTTTAPSPLESSLQVVKIKKNVASRIFHALLAVAFLILALLALISVSTFAAINNEVREDSIFGRTDSKGLEGDYGTCMLYGHHACTLKYLDSDGTPMIVTGYFCPSSGHTCDASIGGQIIVLIVAVVLCTASIIKSAVGFRVFNPFAIVELIAVAFTFMMSLITSGLITGGLANTCQAFRDFREVDDDIPCCIFSVPTDNKALYDEGDDSKRIYFFEPFNASEITSWAATIIIFIAGVIYSIIVLLYIIRKVNRRHLVEYTPQENDENMPNVLEGTASGSYKQ